MKVYVFMAKYDDEKKSVTLYEKDIEKAYTQARNLFGSKGFQELYFSYSKEV